MDINARLASDSGNVDRKPLLDPQGEAIVHYRLQLLRMNSRPHPFLPVAIVDDLDIRCLLERAAEAEDLDPEPA